VAEDSHVDEARVRSEGPPLGIPLVGVMYVAL